MATNQTSILVGVFEKETQARQAIDALKGAGFGYDQIGVAMREGGAVTTNLLNDLMGLGVPQDRASYYDNEFKAGRTIVSVRPDGRDAEVRNIFNNAGAYDYDQNMVATQNADYAQTNTGNYTQTANTDTTGYVDQGDQQRLRLREEQLQATKERVQTGEVELRKDVVTEQKTLNVPVTHEEVLIERRPVTGGQVDNTPIGDDETISIPVSEEQVNVTKTPVVTGEVAVGKRAVQETQQVSDTVRREEARVENPNNLPIHGTENDIFHRDQTQTDVHNS